MNQAEGKPNKAEPQFKKPQFKAGIFGASGYVGAELLRYLTFHPSFEVVYAGAESSAGKLISDAYPNLGGSYPNMEFENFKSAPSDMDVAFLALPHNEANQKINQIWDKAAHIIDLAADFRLEPSQYEAVYGSPHKAPDKQAAFVTGLPEFFKEELKGAKAVSVPGCYPTAAALALKPFADSGIIKKERIIVDAASGVSGAGKTPNESNLFGNVEENFFAYKLASHRHTAEMENLLGTKEEGTKEIGGVLFTPHLAPMNRGILATCYAEPAKNISTADLLESYDLAYKSAPFIKVIRDSGFPPATKNTLGSNSAHIHALLDERTNTVIALSAIDNLGKGAAGQAVQCANLVLGLEEAAGIPISGIFP